MSKNSLHLFKTTNKLPSVHFITGFVLNQFHLSLSLILFIYFLSVLKGDTMDTFLSYFSYYICRRLRHTAI